MLIIEAPVSRVDRSELRECVKLAVSRGWSPDERKWRLLFEIGEVYAVPAPDGGFAACAALANLGELGAISMMLVAERYGRRGLGSRLMRHAMDRAGDRVVVLHASAFGRPLYEKLGFRAVSAATEYSGELRADAVPGVRSRPATSGDQAAIRRLDAEVVGSDRTPLLDVLLTDSEHVHVVEKDGEIAGYATGTRYGNEVGVGPLIAADDNTACALLQGIGDAEGGRIRADLDTRYPAVAAWAAAGGLVAGWTAPFMVHGGRVLPGDAARRYGPVMRALG